MALEPFFPWPTRNRQTGKVCSNAGNIRIKFCPLWHLLRVPDNLQSESVCFALDRFGSFLSHDGKYVAGRKIMEKMVPMVKIIWGAKSLIALGARLDLTAIYRVLGLHEKALSLAHTVLKESRENWGEKHEITLKAMEHVASWLGDLRRYEDAIKLQEIVYETRKGVLGEKDPATIKMRTDLAASYQAVGRFEEAKIYGDRALADSMETFRKRDSRTLRTMELAAGRCVSREAHEDARSIFMDILEVYLENFGDQHPGTLVIMSRLSDVLYHLGRLEESMYFAVKAAEGAEITDHPTVDIFRRNVAVLRAKVEAGPGVMNSNGREKLEIGVD
jgi:tetratricopeptide (TPR) repeat protein